MRHFQQFKLIFFFIVFFSLTNASWSFYREGLSGIWYHNGQPTSVEKNGLHQYLFCNENRECATGFSSNNRIFQVPQWSVTGVLSYDLNLINWSNGTTWLRNPNYTVSIAGRWFHNGQPTFIEFNRRNNFFLTNEEGQTSRGYIEGNKLILPSLNIVGYLSGAGTLIRWSNNTTWVR